MTSKTRLKPNEFSLFYTPKELPTPNKDNNEVSKTIFMHISRLHNLISNWLKVIEKGTKVCKTISALQLHDCKDDYYPHQTKELTESLLDALNSLKDVVEGIKVIDNQLRVLTKLQQDDFPVIFTWTASEISKNVSNILSCIEKEYILKLTLTENIAHCRDESLMEVYVSAWEFNVYFKAASSDYLFAETGLPRVA